MTQTSSLGKCSKCGKWGHVKRNKDGVCLCSDCRPQKKSTPEPKAQY